MAATGRTPDDRFGFAGTERRHRERRRRAAVTVAVAVAGLVLHGVLIGAAPGEYDPVVVAVTVGAPLLVLLTAATAFGRWLAFAFALVLTPIAVVTVAYGLWGLPVVAALWWTFAA